MIGRSSYLTQQRMCQSGRSEFADRSLNLPGFSPPAAGGFPPRSAIATSTSHRLRRGGRSLFFCYLAAVATKKPPSGPPKDPKREGGTQLLERQQTKKPRLYRVIMHNDDYTTQEFVVHVLQSYFRKDPTEAMQLMLKVHQGGKAIVAKYTRDMAETKVAVVTDYARENGMPLMLTAEPE